MQVYRSEWAEGKYRWFCRCAWCHIRHGPLDTMAEAIRWAKKHVKQCKHPTSYEFWKPAPRNNHREWLIGFL